MKTFLEFILENQQTSVVFAYGRYNPPTLGHEKLVNVVVNTAQKYNFSYLIVPSHSTKPIEKNPLSVIEKIEILKYMVPEPNAVSDIGTTYINVLAKLQEMGYQHVIQVCGSDRKGEFETVINKYNNIPDKTGKTPFSFKTFKFVSSGERDPDSEGVEGMSASKLRNLAIEGNFDGFVNGMSSAVPEQIKLKTYKKLRKILAN